MGLVATAAAAPFDHLLFAVANVLSSRLHNYLSDKLVLVEKVK